MQTVDSSASANANRRYAADGGYELPCVALGAVASEAREVGPPIETRSERDDHPVFDRADRDRRASASDRG
jgi:hypothetical protein